MQPFKSSGHGFPNLDTYTNFSVTVEISIQDVYYLPDEHLKLAGAHLINYDADFIINAYISFRSSHCAPFKISFHETSSA